MARGQRSVLSAASLVGFLGLAVAGAYGVTQGQVACTLNRTLVVVDLTNTSIATSSITSSTLDAQAIRASPHPP